MEQVIDFFKQLFDTKGWLPRWQTGSWTGFLGWFHIISDLLIWSAYFAIPLAILKYISHRVNASFVRTYFLFAIFILACGSTHLLDAVAFWFPAYRLNALVRFITGVLSWITVFHLIRILPMATSLRSHAELEREIAERKKVEADLKVSNQQLRMAQEIARLGHWQWDVADNKITWSDELYNIYGTRPDGDISYQSYLEKLHPDDKDFVSNAVQRAFTEKKFPSFTHRILLNDGTEKVIASRGEVLTDKEGVVLKMVGTAQDITELQKAQRQLEERTFALESINAELQRFAYVASHDLQEPLRKMMTFGSLLEKELTGNTSEKARMYLDKILQSSGRMQRLIDDILSFSSLRSTSDAFQATDLNEVVQQVLSDMDIFIEETGANIQCEKLPVVEAIPSQMGQLFQNLISNALKFRQPGVPPFVTITCELVPSGKTEAGEAINAPPRTGGYAYSRSGDTMVRIEIRDNGIGFDEAYADRIFEIFQRLHSNKVFEGTGIGLAICKKIMENHHGSITASGKPNQGARFILWLPLSQRHFSTAANATL